jgi:hypothetical protein
MRASNVSKFFVTLVTFLVLTLSTKAQSYTISGTIVDGSDKSSLVGVAVAATLKTDSSIRTGITTDEEGKFSLAVASAGTYKLQVTYIGYKSTIKEVELQNSSIENLSISLTRENTTLETVNIIDRQVRGEQLGDTSQFNAGAYKVNPDATAEDLIKKMPGITSDNQGLKVNGEEVKKVLVDGKPFFGDDPNAALKNLPAEIIDKIQVYDNQSDQARFTGFKDANADKAINIVTKDGKNVGQFGKAYGGYGTDNRYQAGGNVNIFNGDRRVSIIGMSNNINQQNFSISDIISVMSNTTGGASMPSGPPPDGPMGGGNRSGSSRSTNSSNRPPLLVGQQNGVTQTQSLGLNYSDNWGKRLAVSGSYFFNYTDNTNQSDLLRSYYTDSLTYSERGDKITKNQNHRANMRFEYKIDSNNSLTWVPSVTFQNNRYTNLINAYNANGSSGIIGTTNSMDSSQTSGYSISNNLLYQHKFKKPRRTISVNLSTQFNKKEGAGSYYSSSAYESSSTSTILDQMYTTKNFDQTYSGTISYTEPIGKNGQLMYSYSPSLTLGRADKETNDYNSGSSDYSLLDTTLSNKYDNEYQTHKNGLTYRVQMGSSNLSVGADYQIAILNGDQQFPVSFATNRTFHSILPSLNFDKRIGKTENLFVSYRSTTSSPTLSDLQNVLNVSNPLQLTAGNPDLDQTYSHTLMARYGKTNPKTSRNFFVFMMGNYTLNSISNATYIPTRDTVINTYSVSRGSQLTIPVNLDGYASLRTFMVYALPVTALKSNLNLNAGVNYTRTPALINGILNYANSPSLSGGIYLGSNISTALDFSLSYNGNYNIVKNSLQVQSDNNYYNHSANFKINYILAKSLVLSSDVTHTMYSGLSAGFNQSFFLWNASVGYKFLKSKALEAKLSVFDILKQNQNISRSITETYVQDNSNNVLQRYGMLTLTYTIRNFKSGQAPKSNFNLPAGMPPPPGN